jgi:predicted nucleic acid-binding Zn ribbon protein
MARKGQGMAQEALEGLLNGLDSAVKVRESMAMAYWARAVGPQVAAASEPESVRDGVLFVRTKSSTWSHELTFQKAEIIAKLNRMVGRPVIQEIVYRAQGVKKKRAEEAPDAPTDAELAAVRLPAEEQAALRRELDELVSIHDDKLRQTIARRMIREYRLRRWRLEHGWRACRACAAPHHDDGDLCPICRLCR